MNKYVKLGIGAAGFVIFFAVVYFLYHYLSAEYKPEQNLVVQSTEKEEEPPKQEKPEGSPESSVTQPEDTGEEVFEESNGQGSEGEEAQEYTPAIDFVMENEAGEEVTLYDFVGKPIVLNFWASWCGPCKAEIPDFQATYEKLGNDVEFIMLNATDGVQETKEGAKEFIKEQGYTLPFYFDTQMQGSYYYSVYSLPTTFFINGDGDVVAYAQGMIDAETLEYGISMIYQAEEN